MKIPLHNYQIHAKNFMISHPYCGLFLKMGLGKTSIVLEGLWELNPSEHVLIIAPKTIARCTWDGEIKKWGMNIRTQSLIVNEKGKQLKKQERIDIYESITGMKPTIFFINREMVKSLVDFFMDRNEWPFKTVIIDESQSFKSYSSGRFKAMKRVRPYINRLVLLTGSPTPKDLQDLWPQIYLLDEGERLGKNITAYREQYFRPGLVMNGYPVEWIPLHDAEEQIYDKISDLVISMKNKYIKLPPLTMQDIYVELDESEKKLYKKFKEDYVLQIGDEVIEATNAAVLMSKLIQMASGAIYKATGSHEFEIIHKHKLEMCEYLINDTDGSVLLAYWYDSDKKMILEYLAEHDIPAEVFDGSPDMEQRWNRKEIPVMLIQPASGGFGLNLQDGGSTLIWYTLPWSLEAYEQMNARIYRQGQKDPVVIYHIMTKHTVDSKVLKALTKKDMTQTRLIEAVEAEINF